MDAAKRLAQLSRQGNGEMPSRRNAKSLWSPCASVSDEDAKSQVSMGGPLLLQRRDSFSYAQRSSKFIKAPKDGSRQEASRGQDFKPVRTEKEALMTIDEGQINWVEQTTDEELNHALMASLE
ncbi:hypothetical protein Tco_0648109 [Tanacetum coccineum]